jgi:hypothetical protein
VYGSEEVEYTERWLGYVPTLAAHVVVIVNSNLFLAAAFAFKAKEKVGREVNGDGDICLIKVDGLGESVTVDVVVVNAETESYDDGCTVEILVVYGV